MSDIELERFVGDLGKDVSLLEYVKKNATGLASLVASGKTHGYDFTIDEAKKLHKSQKPGWLDRQADRSSCRQAPFRR
ncbi:hypothetical protein ACOJBO_02850 [Rhizobium beringeri]